MSELLTMNSLWIGPNLGAMHILCLMSARRQGHKVRLFTYQRQPNVPSEIEQVNANEVVPEQDVWFHHKTGSPGCFSNRFRVELIAAGHGAWTDTDHLFLKPVRDHAGFLACWENPADPQIYDALLYFNPGTPFAEEFLEWVRRTDYIPPWSKLPERAKLTLRRILGRGAHVSHHQWGSTGPWLLGYLCEKHGMNHLVSDTARFCPVPYGFKQEPFLASGNPERFFTPETETVHLWNQGMKGGMDGKNNLGKQAWPFEPGSFLWRTAEELGLSKDIAWCL